MQSQHAPAIILIEALACAIHTLKIQPMHQNSEDQFLSRFHQILHGHLQDRSDEFCADVEVYYSTVLSTLAALDRQPWKEDTP